MSDKSSNNFFNRAASLTILLFIGGIAMAIVGGISGNVIIFGIGLGIAVTITVAGIIIREKNISS